MPIMSKVTDCLNRQRYGINPGICCSQISPGREGGPHGANRLGSAFGPCSCPDARVVRCSPRYSCCFLWAAFRDALLRRCLRQSLRQAWPREVLIPPNLDVNSTETVVESKTPVETPESPPASASLGEEQFTFALPDAIAYALQNNPRLRSARAAIERAPVRNKSPSRRSSRRSTFCQKRASSPKLWLPALPDRSALSFPAI